MKSGSANLRVSYLGGGYDYPEFFKDHPVVILAEGLPLSVVYKVEKDGFWRDVCRWISPVSKFSGLGGSAARHLSFLRYHFESVDFKELVNVAIVMDGLQRGGWQDAIASAHDGFIKIRLYQDDWSVELIETELHKYRRLYEIPVCSERKEILSEMTCRASSFDTMRTLVEEGESALQRDDYEAFGSCVKKAWGLKKRWHSDISNFAVQEMEDFARDVGAWGWKVCGAGGQGFFLVIGDSWCHSQMGEKYKCISR